MSICMKVLNIWYFFRIRAILERKVNIFAGRTGLQRMYSYMYTYTNAFTFTSLYSRPADHYFVDFDCRELHH